ncbi:uncharacterized protein BP01DRAFT_384782 [Aspergillus saccharolyticus JOP 1030-1]|uniref:CHAT domain-containing protein n=1 Tax=Aspergillus saccharolyticus JOP 1030-1 TaxID=1450539 RepID=A0A318Z9I9_9EURO|nr:hypothetical protein BP01DRAFT_384782 [Aspergillus saccharolyticus JOP 1030-1]PYH43087.1 hypothetical protein BP01DRAFT_384782 [Aspergillus saccharolyticus JOP 1030-1]
MHLNHYRDRFWQGLQLESLLATVNLDLESLVVLEEWDVIFSLNIDPWDAPLIYKYAEDVADVLRQNEVKMVVLNACRSANAGPYLNANIAWTFVRKGISEVVASSFDLHRDAAKIFMSHFYHEILVKGLGFTVSAAEARRRLRTSRT